MEELIRMVVQKTGIPEDKARMAVDVVVNHLKGQLPGALSGQIDSALQGGGGHGGGQGVEGMLGKLGGR